MAIIAVLIGLLLPAVQGAREAGRRTQCRNKMRQLGLAMTQYENAHRLFPPSLSIGLSTGGVLTTNGWGINVRLLPFLEQGNDYDEFNFDVNYGGLENFTSAGHVHGAFLCPSDPNSMPTVNANFGTLGNINFGWCMGDWFVWRGFGPGPIRNRSMFGPNQCRTQAEVVDGMSRTMFNAEVKSWQPYYRDCPTLANIQDPYNVPGPDADPYTVAPEYLGTPCVFKPDGHAEWVETNVNHLGMTTAWTPNRKIVGGVNGEIPDVDLTSRREKIGGPTFAAMTARSWHGGGVNILMGDGGVHFISENIDGSIWRSLGTVAGGETDVAF